jgi:uncharacterized membrane protein YccF (DUF307 family)
MSSILGSKLNKQFNVKKAVLSFAIILAISFVALQIPFTHIAGSSKSFTLFDFLAPTMGALWGSALGIVSILTVNFINLLIKGDFSLSAWIRLLPILFAIYHFAKRSKLSGLVGIVCMVLFVAHPIGRQAWTYSLYWLIPLATVFISSKNVFTSALGATFTQHAIGSVAFLYAFGYTPAYWNALIPQVAGERLLMALGISVSYVGFQAIVRLVGSKITLPNFRKATNLITVE